MLSMLHTYMFMYACYIYMFTYIGKEKKWFLNFSLNAKNVIAKFLFLSLS